MRILGIDPGSNATGFGVVEGGRGPLRALAWGVLRAPRGAPAAERLRGIQVALAEVIAAHRPDVAAVERIFVAASARSALQLGEARGVALAAAAAAGLPVFGYTPAEIKRAVTTTGAARKPQVQAMVTRLLALERAPAADAADALAAAICHSHAGPLSALSRGGRRRRRRRPVPLRMPGAAR